MRPPSRTIILASGSGSNFQALLDDNRQTQALEIVGLISDNPEAFALRRAAEANIPTRTVAFDKTQPRDHFDEALAKTVSAFAPELIILAGFMRIIAAPLVAAYEGRMLNIHPALLPRYKGLNTHQRCLDNRDSLHGTTVHFVTAALDDGPAVIQARLAVAPGETADGLSARVQAMEYKIYPLAARWFAEGRLSMHDGHAILDNQPLASPIIMTEEDLE
ncbi:MAG: phosphoribosylglycinamide formyltransferase [Woeseiaceae bacterium]